MYVQLILGDFFYYILRDLIVHIPLIYIDQGLHIMRCSFFPRNKLSDKRDAPFYVY